MFVSGRYFFQYEQRGVVLIRHDMFSDKSSIKVDKGKGNNVIVEGKGM